MRNLSAHCAAIDAANAEDPRRFDGRPLALVQGERCWAWVLELSPDGSAPLLLAARAHHLRRWELARTSYPEGRAGYLRWRREQKCRHAMHLRNILEDSTIDQSHVERAVEIIQKHDLGADPEVQTFEDAVCLTFLETELSPTTDRVADDQKMASVVAKTLTKMSPEGRSRIDSIRLRDRDFAIAAAALQLL